jgi:integrase
LAVLGRSDVLTLDQGRRKARSYLGEVSDGSDPKAVTDELRGAVTCKRLVEIYLERHARPKKRSWKIDESALRRFFIPKFGSHLASSITFSDIANLHAEIGKTHRHTANRFVAIVRKMFNVGRRIGLLARELRNPATEIDQFPEAKRRRYVTASELPRLAAAIDADANEFATHAIWLLLLTGIRRSEILAAKWDDINWQDRTLFVGKTKNGEPVLAPLSQAAITRLKRIPRVEGNPYVICGSIPGKPLAYLDSMWRRIRTETGLHDLRIHDLRRTVGSWLVSEGASLHLVGAILNHKDQKTTAGYAYFDTHDRQRALDRHGKKLVKHASLIAGQKMTDVKDTGTRIRQFSRKALHRIIWSEPMTLVSRKLGISDVGLAKACRRHDIPVPDRGYWSRHVAARVKMRLPPQKIESKSTISFRVDGRGQRPKPSPVI